MKGIGNYASSGRAWRPAVGVEQGAFIARRVKYRANGTAIIQEISRHADFESARQSALANLIPNDGGQS